MRAFVGGAALVLLLQPVPARAQDGDDDCERCVQAAVEAQCPCNEFAKHGAYVECVEEATAEDGLGECRDAAVACAERSTCGRKRAVVCEFPKPGKCDKKTGTCQNGGAQCEKNRDCDGRRRCVIARSAERCEERGGTVSSRTSCCPPCGEGDTQCCVQSSMGGAFDECIVVSSAECSGQGGIDVGSGACGAGACPPGVTTSLTTPTTTVTTTSVTTTLATTTSTTSTTTTTSTLPGSPSGAFVGS